MAKKPEHIDSLAFPILVGDIGGTNARFALLADAAGEPIVFPVVPTADYPNIDDAIEAVVFAHTAIKPKTAVLAIAGPVDGEEIELTNNPWVVRPQALIADLGFEDVLILNDFEAQALAVSALPESGRDPIGGGTVLEGASRVVMGPGTGLGVAGLIRSRDRWIPVPGEGGHMDLGPRTDRERAIWPHLETLEGRVSGEQVLCGRGLVNLYHAIAAVDGASATLTLPAEVSEAAAKGADPVAHEAVQLFAVILARVAGDLALVFMARGGVYIAGGVFGRIAALVDPAAMREAFEDKAPHRELLRGIPLFSVTLPLAALAGLAAFARRPHLYALETGHRRWSR